MYFVFYSTQKITIDKQFINKRKTVSQNDSLWLKAEKHFPAVAVAMEQGTDVKINIVVTIIFLQRSGEVIR